MRAGLRDGNQPANLATFALIVLPKITIRIEGRKLVVVDIEHIACI